MWSISNEFRNLEVQIVEFVDDHQPGTVKCEFADAHGQVHKLLEKVPVVSLEMLDANSIYPRLDLFGARYWSGGRTKLSTNLFATRPMSLITSNRPKDYSSYCAPTQIRTHFTLEELLAESDHSKPDSPEDHEWIDAPRAGHELI